MTTHKEASKFLSTVSDKEEFVLHMGCNISSLKELDEALDIMAERTFKHHVNSQKNDFAVWIRESIGDLTLADKVGHIRDRKELVKLIRKRIEDLDKVKSSGEIDSKEFMRSGVADFSIGAIIGFIVGIIIATLV